MPADDRVDALFAGAPEDFVAARDALVKQLRSEGDKALAGDVKALRRPTVAAWAVNQVARTARTEVAQLIRLGDRLRDAHDALLQGRGDAGIRDATAERRKLVAKLTKQAVALLGAGGDAQAEAITHTFDAAVADPEAGMAVREGRLSKELQAPSGFGGGVIFRTDPPPPAPSRSRRNERRAARRSHRAGGDSGPPEESVATDPAGDAADADAPAPGQAPPRSPDDGTPGPTSVSARRKAAEVRAEAEMRARRRRELQRDAEEQVAEAQQAAREAAAARQEVSRLHDLLVTADARAKSAAEKAQLAQWKAATARRAVDEASTTE